MRSLESYDLPRDEEFVGHTLFSARLGALHYLGYTLYHRGDTTRDLAAVRRMFDLT
jgi:hypothetical protein